MAQCHLPGWLLHATQSPDALPWAAAHGAFLWMAELWMGQLVSLVPALLKDSGLIPVCAQDR